MFPFPKLSRVIDALRLYLGRRHISSAIGAYTAAHTKIQKGITVIEGAVKRTESFVDEERAKLHDVIDRATIEFQQKEAEAQQVLGTLAAERDKAVRVADKFKQFFEA